MAYPLSSPGVDIEVTDEAFYAASAQGTVPLFVIGTHEYKTQPNSSTIANGTLPANANTLYLITSQRELIQTFGNPVFYSSQGTPQDGYELNEYGLHAAYQYLGLSPTAYVIRGPVDYSQLAAQAFPPVGLPVSGTYWLNTATTSWGIQEYTGTSWVNQLPIVITQDSDVAYRRIGIHAASNDPTTSFITSTGNLHINTHTISLPANTALSGVTSNNVFTPGVVDLINTAMGVNCAFTIGLNGHAYLMIVDLLNEGKLDLAGTDASILTDCGFATGGVTDAAVIAPKPNLGTDSDYAINALYNDNEIFQKKTSYYKVNNAPVPSMAVWAKINSNTWKLGSMSQPNSPQSSATFGPHYTLPANPATNDVWIVTTPYNNGANFTMRTYSTTAGAWVNVPAPLYATDADAVSGIGSSALSVNNSIYIRCPGPIDATTNFHIGSFTPMILSAINTDGSTQWSELTYQAQETAPTTDPEDGTLWFDNQFRADIMVTTGQAWEGYRNMYSTTDPNGPILDASAPTAQSDGTPLVDNDLWINTSLAALEKYPQIYRYTAQTRTWNLINTADNTTPNGIIFGDARWNIDGSKNGSQDIRALVSSNFVDPDAPDPLLYPTGLLLFNTRYSTQNVKQWQSTQFLGLFENTDYTETSYTVGTATLQPVPYGGRWVTVSGSTNNVPYMGRKAQRRVIVEALKAVVNSNESLLSETFNFTLMAAPGYPELIGDLVSLNDEKKNVAFVVGDPPARLDPSGTSIVNWATNTRDVEDNGDDGLVTASPYLGIWYPWGVSTNIDGSTVVVPSSTIALRTIAYSDNISYPWYTPAGYTRGLVNNATSVGHIDPTTGAFMTVMLNQGQRDVLYQNSINPIAYVPNRGLVILGDKTRSPVANAENRINVARLVNYLRYNLNNIAQPFLFEPNVQHTQDSAKTVMERFLSNLITLNALYDFIVVCDASNNTPDRVDNNELWIDIAIQPVRTVDFIYIPLRIETTGTDLASLYKGNSGKLSR